MIITVANTKGGIGKTTTVIVLAELIKNALLIDASQDSNLTAYFQIAPEARKRNIYAYLTQKNIVPTQLDGRLSIFPASINTANESNFEGINIKKKLSALPYSNIIIDTQPSLSKFTISCIDVADILLIPFDMDLWAAESALLVSNYSKKDKTYFIPTKYKSGKYQRNVIKFIENNKKYGEILKPIPYNNKAYLMSYNGKLDNPKLLKNYNKSLRKFL